MKTALVSRKARLVAESYRAPARFLLLRNQMRDTVRILSFGYPIFVLLALPAYFRLKQWGSGEMARRIVFAWTGTYISLLLLKDPAFFPQLFLHVKEDLLFAPLICILGGMTLAAMWKRSRVGRVTLRKVPGEADPVLLGELIFSSIRWNALIESDPRILIRDQVRRDFGENHVVRLGQWTLSRTEARLCALTILAKGDEPQ